MFPLNSNEILSIPASNYEADISEKIVSLRGYIGYHLDKMSDCGLGVVPSGFVVVFALAA